MVLLRKGHELVPNNLVGDDFDSCNADEVTQRLLRGDDRLPR